MLMISIGFLVTYLILNARSDDGSSPSGSSKLPPPAAVATSSSALQQSALGPEGWSKIHVHFGTPKLMFDELAEEPLWIADSPIHHNGTRWPSQHKQDITVARVLNFKKDGYFVDLAANDAVWASNTFVLERNFDWKGICIEPSPLYWQKLAYRTNCHLVGGIAGAVDMDEVHFKTGLDKIQGPLGGIIGQEFDNKGARKKFRDPRYTVTLRTLLDKFEAPTTIDYMSLDVEGAELFILKNFFEFSASKYTFRCISIERPNDELQDILRKHGYKPLLKFKRGDTLWVHESFYTEAEANNAKSTSDTNTIKQLIAGSS
jgi:hypothetical protein